MDRVLFKQFHYPTGCSIEPGRHLPHPFKGAYVCEPPTVIAGGAKLPAAHKVHAT